MRFIVYGAGAIGGVVGGRLSQGGHDVVLVGRGPHGAAIRADGLRLESPAGSALLPLPLVEDVADISFTSDDVVLLSVKSQDTVAALGALAAVAPEDLAIVCMQNGAANERAALRLFERVYAMVVMLPAVFLRPGVVEAHSSPVTGMMDVGRYPDGVDETAVRIAAAFTESTLVSEARPDIMAWKYRKLLGNLGNAVQVLIGLEGARDQLLAMARTEGERVLAAAAIDVVTTDQDAKRRGDLLHIQPISGRQRGGGSTWQSVQRKAGTVETDYLNGEIVLLGRLHGEPAPVNRLLQRLMRDVVAGRLTPGSLTERAIMDLVVTDSAESTQRS